MSYETLIPILTGISVIAVGGAILAARVARRAPLQARLRGLENRPPEMLPPSTGGQKLAEMVGGIGTVVSSGRSSLTLKEQLTQAGYHNSSSAAVYVGAKAILLVTGLLAFTTLLLPTNLATGHKSLLILMGAMLLFFIPNIVVVSRRAKRRGEVQRHLPDAIDLLEICASAGMGLDMAWNSVTDEVRNVSNVLADEMALTNLEIHLGATRAEAMRHMSKRTGAEELSSLVAVLVQSERFGTSVIDALRTFATSMREQRSMKAQEAAEKMAVKLIFPMILFIFPAVVMVMAGPAGMALYKTLAPK